jgi:hypothetical protein
MHTNKIHFVVLISKNLKTDTVNQPLGGMVSEEVYGSILSQYEIKLWCEVV